MTRRPPYFVTKKTRSLFRQRQTPKRRSACRPAGEGLEQRLVMAGLLVTGSGKGSPAEVSVFDSGTGAPLFQFAPYGTSFQGGVQVGVGDVDGNGSLDIVTAPGAGMPGLVKVFSSANGTELGEFLAGPKGYKGGLSVAVGDVTGDGNADIVVGNLRGPAMVGVFQGVNGQPVGSFRAAVGGGSGVQVALGDLNLDTHDDIVTAPVTGRPWITIYDGASHKVLSRKLAFSGKSPSGIAIAVGDVDANRQPDVIVAQGTKQGAVVRIFSGAGSTPMLTDTVPGTQFAHGVRVAAIDVGGGLGGDDVALAPASGGGAAATVLDFSAIRPSLLGPPLTSADFAQVPGVVYQLPSRPGGAFLAGSNAVSQSTPAFLAGTAQTSSTLLPYQRLARFQFDSVTGAPELVPVVPNDPSLVGKHVIVLVHGWAADYSYWVDDVAKNNNSKLPNTLTWWDTDPSQPGYNLNANLEASQQATSYLHPVILGPASNFLLHGYDNLGIEASETGLAQNIAARAAKVDPNTVVLAYTWIDDSGTSSLTNPYLSEAYTVEDGERLADGLRTVLGSQAAFGGQIQIIGHSHGSKVATVAAVSLTTKNAPDTFAVRQLTLLDSPEDLYTVDSDLWADNFNWYYLQNLNISKTDPNATFVDNYISSLSEPYSNITTPSGKSLGQVVDVKLDSTAFPLTDGHSYSAYWYTGSGESDLSYGQPPVGQEWSPLLPGNQGGSAPPANLTSSYYTQNWASSSFDPKQQFALTPGTLDARPYSAYALPFDTPTSSASVVASNTSPSGTGASVALTQTQGVSQPSYTSGFYTEHGSLSGISFNYSFPAGAPDATISIVVDKDLVFVIDSGSVAPNSTTDGTRAGVGTLNMPQGEFDPYEHHTMTVTLSPGTGVTNAQGSLTNLNFFYA